MTKKILLLATGGTIASRYDADHDDVRAVGHADDLTRWVRSHTQDVDVEARDIMTVNSYQMTLADLFHMAGAIRHAVDREDVAGVVVTHGTDTMEESVFMADLLVDTDKPVVFTGAQRSADDPYADGPANLLDAIRVANSPAARGYGALVAFGQEIHAARWVSKTHTSALRAFQSPGKGPLGIVDGERVVLHYSLDRHAQMECTAIEPRVDLVRLYVGADARFIDCAVATGARALVLEAFGRGNATAAVLEGIQRAVARNIPVIVTSRCPQGLVEPVYGGSGGAALARAGALFAPGIGGAKARILLSALLGRSPSAETLRTDLLSFLEQAFNMRSPDE
jgi:L-asparaginase